MAIFRPKPSQIFFFGLVPKSTIHIGLIYVKNPKPNISCLGPFKLLKLDFNADRDPAFHSNADPYPASIKNADPCGSESGSVTMILWLFEI